MDFDLIPWLTAQLNTAFGQMSSRAVALQASAIVLTLCVSWFCSQAIKKRLGLVEVDDDKSTKATAIRQRVGNFAYQIRDLLFPAISVCLLGVTVALAEEFFDRKWLVQFVQGVNFLMLAYLFATRVTGIPQIRYFMLTVFVPIIILYAINLLDEVIRILASVEFHLGNIEFSLYSLARTLVFGIILFWLGRLSNTTGKRLIKQTQALDQTAQELVLKLFQIALFVIIFLLILQVAGIDLTALVVFGGAIGVGLGFGLQQIASNFISGIIILIDRSISIGDFIELEDGRSGTLRELSMRSATLETFDGKDIMVPNERFITTAFTNWTHNNLKQRYPILFEVPYGTDLDAIFPVLKDVVASHPQVLSGDDVPWWENPDAEVSGFNESGIEILVEFWMEGVDDGKNRVGGDLNLMIWQALRDMDVHMPFPQREIRILNKDA